MRFPYGCICRKNFFDKTETTDTTDTTIWKPGLKTVIYKKEYVILLVTSCIQFHVLACFVLLKLLCLLFCELFLRVASYNSLYKNRIPI